MTRAQFWRARLLEMCDLEGDIIRPMAGRGGGDSDFCPIRVGFVKGGHELLLIAGEGEIDELEAKYDYAHKGYFSRSAQISNECISWEEHSLAESRESVDCIDREYTGERVHCRVSKQIIRRLEDITEVAQEFFHEISLGVTDNI